MCKAPGTCRIVMDSLVTEYGTVDLGGNFILSRDPATPVIKLNTESDIGERPVHNWFGHPALYLGEVSCGLTHLIQCVFTCLFKTLLEMYCSRILSKNAGVGKEIVYIRIVYIFPINMITIVNIITIVFIIDAIVTSQFHDFWRTCCKMEGDHKNELGTTVGSQQYFYFFWDIQQHQVESIVWTSSNCLLGIQGENAGVAWLNRNLNIKPIWRWFCTGLDAIKAPMPEVCFFIRPRNWKMKKFLMGVV